MCTDLPLVVALSVTVTEKVLLDLTWRFPGISEGEWIRIVFCRMLLSVPVWNECMGNVRLGTRMTFVVGMVQDNFESPYCISHLGCDTLCTG